MNGNGTIEIFKKMLENRETKAKELHAQLDELEKELEAIRLIFRLHMKEHGIPELSPAPLLEHGLSLSKRREQALIQWAERNNGTLVIKDARRALEAAGLAKSSQTWVIYGVIYDMDCWERIDRGKYRLTTLTPKAPMLIPTPASMTS